MPADSLGQQSCGLSGDAMVAMRAERSHPVATDAAGVIVDCLSAMLPPASGRASGAFPHLAEMLPRQNLALLDRRLVEGVDAEQVGGDDRLQHEMHDKRAETALVQSLELEAARRPAVADEAGLSGALFGVEQVAHAAAGEVPQLAVVDEIGRHAPALAGDGERDQREHLVGGTGEIKLQLAVLVDG